MADISAETVITALTIAAGLALGIERSLELLKHFMESGNGVLTPGEQKGGLAKTQQAIQEAEDAVAGKGTTVAARSAAITTAPTPVQVNQTVADSEAGERYPQPRIPIIPLTPLSPVATAQALFFQLAAAGLGIILVWLFDVRLLALLTSANHLGVEISGPFAVLDVVFSGLVVGGGSQPIHLLIRFLTERKISRETEEAVEENEKVKHLAKVVSSAGLVEQKKEKYPLAWRNIVYKGGVNPQSLENNHQRPADPELIVYHHTAMSSASSFQDIVDEFLKKKKWLTGYHCVIMPDGSIKPFCRWDRYGNHAKGLNARSLGIAFHGNFHTDPTDKYSNADGRYGNQQPTEAQLHAGARVVALWVSIYDGINLDFEKSILPHKIAMPNHTVCPGSNFSYKQFELSVKQYHEAWADSDEAQAKIAEFKDPAITQYVYA